MRDLAADGMTMIVVTHEMAFAGEAADRVVFMDDGVVVEQGPPSQVLGNPQQERTRSFLSRVRQEVDAEAEAARALAALQDRILQDEQVHEQTAPNVTVDPEQKA
jgi:polar amino acid transport system ATP-binding protein